MTKLDDLKEVARNFRLAVKFVEEHPGHDLIGFGRVQGETDVYLQYYTLEDLFALAGDRSIHLTFHQLWAVITTRVRPGLVVSVHLHEDDQPDFIKDKGPRWTEPIEIKREE